MEAVLGFAWGACVELGQLLLVLVAAFIAPDLAAGPLSAPLADLATIFVFFAAYSAFALVPARDLVEGWLGMFAGRCPASYQSRGANLGRALVKLSPLLLLGMPLVGTDKPPEVQAFARAFVLVAILVFCIGGAVPRFWFAVRGGTGDASTAIPELLREAGRRGARLFYAAFLGLGLGIVVARAVAPDTGGDYRPSELEIYGEGLEGNSTLCRPAWSACPDHVDLGMREVVTGRVSILFGDSTYATSEDTRPRCKAALPGLWPLARADRDALADELNAPEPAMKLHASVRAGDYVLVRLTVPDGADGCTYYFRMSPPASGESP